jgi:hypothetical protein
VGPFFGYEEPSTSRGIAYGAARGALVRAAAFYPADAEAGRATGKPETLAVLKRKRPA